LEETNDDAEWTVSKASAMLITKIALLLKDNLWVKTMEFANSRINSESWID